MLNMKLQRAMKGLTQEQLAEKVGISRTHVTRIERGNIKPSIRVAKRLATVLNVDWRDFYDD